MKCTFATWEVPLPQAEKFYSRLLRAIPNDEPITRTLDPREPIIASLAYDDSEDALLHVDLLHLPTPSVYPPTQLLQSPYQAKSD
jgi:hypothetical protein